MGVTNSLADDDGLQKISAKGYAGIKRKQKNSYGILYDKTPILYSLPQIGSKVRIYEVMYDGQYRKTVKPVWTAWGKDIVFTVRHYTQGIEKPLARNNFTDMEYETRAGVKLAMSFRTIDLALGLLMIRNVDETNKSCSKKTDTSKTGHFV